MRKNSQTILLAGQQKTTLYFSFARSDLESHALKLHKLLAKCLQLSNEYFKCLLVCKYKIGSQIIQNLAL